jgi:hypothetical protein
MNGPALAVAAYWAPVLETIADLHSLLSLLR